MTGKVNQIERLGSESLQKTHRVGPFHDFELKMQLVFPSKNLLDLLPADIPQTRGLGRHQQYAGELRSGKRRGRRQSNRLQNTHHTTRAPGTKGLGFLEKLPRDVVEIAIVAENFPANGVVRFQFGI